MRGRTQDFEIVCPEGVMPVALHHKHADKLLVHENRHIHFGSFVARRQVARLGGDLRRVVEPAVEQRELAQSFAWRDAES
jgi:hypothetical protein